MNAAGMSALPAAAVLAMNTTYTDTKSRTVMAASCRSSIHGCHAYHAHSAVSTSWDICISAAH